MVNYNEWKAAFCFDFDVGGDIVVVNVIVIVVVVGGGGVVVVVVDVVVVVVVGGVGEGCHHDSKGFLVNVAKQV